MADDMDRLLENIGTGRAAEVFPALATSLSRDVWNDGPASDRGIWSPQVETFRRGDKLVVRADLPGLKKEDVKVEIEDGILTISGERSDEHKEDKDGFFRTERSYGRFSRMLALPDGVSEEKCDATFNNGVLEVTLPVPKQTERKAKEIGIR
jgi:HSP20 family protein